MKVSIRNVREDDAESIAELLNPIIRAGTYTIMHEEVSVNDQIEFIRGIPDRAIYNLAIDDDTGRVVGIQDIVPCSQSTHVFKHVSEISTFVSMDCHWSGVGRELSKVTLREARRLGFLKIMATVRADNPQAIAFYQNLGFEIIGTAKRHACIRGIYVDEILMEHFLE